MFLHLHRPSPPLDRFVELVTFYSGYEPGHTRERLLPDGAVEIIVDLTDTPKRLFDRDDATRSTAFRGAWISGMRRDWILIEAAPGSSMCVIRFRPGGAFPFLGFPVEGVTGTVDSLDAVLGPEVSVLRERVLEATDVASRMEAVEDWLIERARGRLESHPAVEYVVQRLFAPAGIRVADVVAELGYSQRHVTGLFRRFVGLPPKTYGRLRRFQGVLQDLAAGAEAAVYPSGSGLSEPDWADVALRHGYYDQPHLARDFRELAGLTPGDYVRRFRGLENYLPFD